MVPVTVPAQKQTLASHFAYEVIKNIIYIQTCLILIKLFQNYFPHNGLLFQEALCDITINNNILFRSSLAPATHR